MSVEKIPLLLIKSHQLYTGRNLPDAIDLAQEALVLAETAAFPEAKIAANLLLGQAYGTRAKYQGDLSLFAKALDYLHLADQLNEAPQKHEKTLDIWLALGDTYQNKEAYEAAKAYFSKARTYALDQKDLRGEILICYAESQLAISQNDFQQARLLVEEGLEKMEAHQQDDDALRAEAYYLLTQIYRKRQDYASLLGYCEPLLKISKKLGDVEKEMLALNYLAIYHGVQADYAKSMQYLLEALEISKTTNYRKATAQYLINIGTIYAQILNYEETLLRYQAVLEDYDDVIEVNDKAIVLNNVGNHYYLTQRFAEAQDHFQQALDLARQAHYREMIVLSLAQISRTYTALGDIEKALTLANEAQEIINEIGDVNGRQINLLNLANIKFLQGDFDRASILTSQGIVTAKRMNDETHELVGYQLQAKIHRELKNFEKALQYQTIYSELQKDFSREQMKRQAMDLEIKYNIHEKRNQIEQLTKENQLQALLLEQKDQIVKQNSQLLQVNEELRQFAYVASHDLKEPLRMIGSYTQLIFRRNGQDFDKDSKSYFDFVSEGVNRMNNLLDALLRYATIGKTDEEFEVVHLKDAVELAMINLRVRIEETKANIIMEELPVVRSIQSLLIQLFQNLVSNALKFRQPNVNPVVRIRAYEEAEEIIVCVEDNGIGIASEYQERIFVIFQRLHSRARYEGTGIGLSICLKIVQRLGGRIWIESEVDKGATFLVALPKVPGQKESSTEN